MTLVVIGPVTRDVIVVGSEVSSKVGGATYYQSFVFEKFYPDYLAVVNCSHIPLCDEFPDPSKVKVIKKDTTHFFINRYPFKDNRDIREQLSNFAEIPIFKEDLEDILPDEIDAFILNPLNRFDFPVETVEYLKSFNVPVFISLQGFLRLPDSRADENYTIKLDSFDKLDGILRGVTSIFLDEAEAGITGTDFDVDETVITDGSRGSRILCGDEIRIDAVECGDAADTTGCGDTYMAAYIAHRLSNHSVKESGDFASFIASEKIKNSL